jgi:hypothetical protein
MDNNFDTISSTTGSLGPYWEEYIEEESGNIFYYNKMTNTTQWEHPNLIKNKVIPSIKPSRSNKIYIEPIVDDRKKIEKNEEEKKNLIGGTTIDYLHCAKLYKVNRPYGDHTANSICVLCRKNISKIVFFPCEHHAVCQECVIREKIYEFGSIESVQPNSHYNCPLCSEVIKKILPCENGLEVEKYWQWVL